MYERNVSNIEELAQKQNEWRRKTLNFIASENVLSNRARQVMGSDFAHRYAEGHPGERYYQGTEIIDEIESRVKKNLKSLFCCKHADVRPISGTVSNEAVFSRYINPGDVVMVNSTPGGGQEMTRFGMKEPETEMIVSLFKKCLLAGKYVGNEVIEFRQHFQKIHYSFDDSKLTQTLKKELEK